MKKILSFLILGGIALMMFSSCKKDEVQTVSTLGSAGTLTTSTTAPALSLATSANTAITFTWTATGVSGYQAGITYTLQIDKKGNNFAAAREIAASSTLTQPVTVGAINTVLLNLNLATGVSTQVEVRLKSVIAANVVPVYSNVLVLTVVPFTLTSYVYVPGAYQGWDPSTAPSLSSPTSTGVYDGVVTFPATAAFEFKITKDANWNLSYGGANGLLSTTGGNLTVPGAGTYLIHVDLNALTYTLTKQ